MVIRQPIVADLFYPAAPDACRDAITACVDRAPSLPDLPANLLGGIVPHAGWLCSGHVAAVVFKALSARLQPPTITLVGVPHRWSGHRAAIDDAIAWSCPLGQVPVDRGLADELLVDTDNVESNGAAHADEHSLEVQVPLIKHFFPSAAILPILVPPTVVADQIGTRLATVLRRRGEPFLIVGTTDLTHYGPPYDFVPHGRGDAGWRWARDVNDRQMIRLLAALDTEAIVPEAREARNACGAGAATCVLAAFRGCGTCRGHELVHTTSREVLGQRGGDASVGYVGLVYSCN